MKKQLRDKIERKKREDNWSILDTFGMTSQDENLSAISFRNALLEMMEIHNKKKR